MTEPERRLTGEKRSDPLYWNIGMSSSGLAFEGQAWFQWKVSVQFNEQPRCCLFQDPLA